MNKDKWYGKNRVIDSGYRAGINCSITSDTAYVYFFNSDRSVFAMKGFRYSKTTVFPVNDF